MARLAAASTPATAAGLPPRASNSQVPDYSSSSFTASSSSSKPQRHSTTDYSSSPRSWGGPGHWSASAAVMGELSGGPSFTGHSPLGTSPLGSGYCSHSSVLYGTSPKLAGSWTGNCAAGGILGSNSRGGSLTISPSPGGSCSSSWTGTSPLAAAVAAGATSLPHPGAVRANGSSDGVQQSASAKGAVELSVAGCAPCPAADKQLQEQLLLLQQLQEESEEPAVADYSLLPEECWVLILQQLGVKELCIMSRISRWA